MTNLLNTLSRILPTYPPDVPQGARAPYAVYTRRETPVRTKEGIAGYDGTVTISIYAGTLKLVDELAERIITALDNKTLGDTDYFYESTDEGEDLSDIGLDAKTLTFSTMR